MLSRSEKELRDPQPKSVDEILRVWQRGALVGSGTARGALLADSMGLGKTASAVVAAKIARMRRVLVVAPKSAIPDWLRELRDWHPGAGVITLSPFAFERGWVIINYELLERDADELRARPWDLLILDEAHATKEPSRRRTILVHGGTWSNAVFEPIPAGKTLVISGTPFKNRLEELFTTLHLLDPTTWPSRDDFINEHYGTGYVVSGDRVVQNVPLRNLSTLHHRLRDTVLVRTHKDNLPNFPTKRFEKVPVPLDDAETRSWFDERAFDACVLARQLRAAQLTGNMELIRPLEERLRRLTSMVRQASTRAKRQAVLDYLLALPREHKVVVIGEHRSLLLTQLAAALRKEKRRLVEHNGDLSKHAAATVRA